MTTDRSRRLQIGIGTAMGLCVILTILLTVAGIRYSVHEGWEASCATATENRTFDLELLQETIQLVGEGTPFAEAMADNVRHVQEPSPICLKARQAWWQP